MSSARRSPTKTSRASAIRRRAPSSFSSATTRAPSSSPRSRRLSHGSGGPPLPGDIERPREPALPVCVDHEGGRVQRFREGFTLIPPMRALGRLWDRDREEAREAATSVGYVIAAELGAHGVDFSFAPVLDLD